MNRDQYGQNTNDIRLGVWGEISGGKPVKHPLTRREKWVTMDISGKKW